jgi:hypothetical protein
MSIATSQLERQAWLARARFAWLQLEDLRAELNSALVPVPQPPAITLLVAADVFLNVAQNEVDEAINRIRGLQP